MATIAADPASVSNGYVSDQSFFIRMAWILAIVIVFSFAQHAALGRVDIPAVPWWTHLHALAMLGWLGLFVTQNRLAGAGNLALHRKLGWVAAFLVCIIVGLGSFTGVMSQMLHRSPPYFSDPFFLALAQFDVVGFGGLVFAGIANRSDTQTHRRLMIGATIVIMEPALGRLLPMPLLGMMGEWLIMVIQLGVVGVIALHDRKTIGRVHTATFSVGVVIALLHVVVYFAGQSAPFIDMAHRITQR